MGDWEMYVDDESFQDLAEGKVFHDAKLLARVLYGEKASENSELVGGENTRLGFFNIFLFLF